MKECDPSFADHSTELAKYRTDDFAFGDTSKADGANFGVETKVFEDVDAAKAALTPFSDAKVLSCIDGKLKEQFSSDTATIEGTFAEDDSYEKTVADVLLPTDSLTTVRRGASGADIEALCAATGFSRFPVEDDRDTGESAPELLGYLHIKDVLEPDEARRQRPVEDKWIRPFATVTPDDALHDALETLQRRGSHMARVVDRAGATIGLATLEDVIEELVGEIRDAAHADDLSTL